MPYALLLCLMVYTLFLSLCLIFEEISCLSVVANIWKLIACFILLFSNNFPDQFLFDLVSLQFAVSDNVRLLALKAKIPVVFCFFCDEMSLLILDRSVGVDQCTSWVSCFISKQIFVFQRVSNSLLQFLLMLLVHLVHIFLLLKRSVALFKALQGASPSFASNINGIKQIILYYH